MGGPRNNKTARRGFRAICSEAPVLVRPGVVDDGVCTEPTNGVPVTGAAGPDRIAGRGKDMKTEENQGKQHAEPDRTRWIGLVYYYLATAVGLAIMLAGVIGSLQGLVTAALPRISSEARFADVEAPKPDGVQLTET